MLEPIIYIGIAQSLFTAIISLSKKPLRIADILLSVWMVEVALLFCTNSYINNAKICEEFWVFSVVISMTYPPTLYLYSKYVTSDLIFFKRKDFLHFLPVLFCILLLLITINKYRVFNFREQLIQLNQLRWAKILLGSVFIITLWIYGVFAIIEIVKHKRQIPYNYSYISGKINLNWFLILIISFLVLYHINIIVSTLVENDLVHMNDDTFRNITLLIFIYITSVWGYRQGQLFSTPDKVKLKVSIYNNNDSGKYLKSKLDKNKAKKYLEKIVNFMVETQAWRDSELSVFKISTQTQIPKHHITQVLNEYLQKNFYAFVNEYRIEYAKSLIISPKYSSWSFEAIAEESGFNSKSSFYTFFKKYTGTTPREYKLNSNH